MACLNVESVNEKINFIEELEDSALEKEAELIKKDLKGYILSNFSVDEFQRKIIDRSSNEFYEQYGKVIANAFLQRYYIVAESAEGRARKCPKITITISISWL